MRNYLIHREVSELHGRTSEDVGDTDNTVDSQHYNVARMIQWRNHQMRPSWSNFMVIVVQDIGPGLMKSNEAWGFIKSHSSNDINDDELRFLIDIL